MCWNHEKKKNPSNTKIVQNASVYAQRKQTAQLISTQNKPKRLVYLDLSHTHTCRKTEGQHLSNDFIESKRMKGGRLSILGQHGVREDTYPHGFPQIHIYVRGLHTILSMRPVGPGVWHLLLKPVIDQKPFCAFNTWSLHHWSLAMGLPQRCPYRAEKEQDT